MHRVVVIIVILSLATSDILHPRTGGKDPPQLGDDTIPPPSIFSVFNVFYVFLM